MQNVAQLTIRLALRVRLNAEMRLAVTTTMSQSEGLLYNPIIAELYNLYSQVETRVKQIIQGFKFIKISQAQSTESTPVDKYLTRNGRKTYQFNY